MNELVTMAIVGTGQQTSNQFSTGTVVDDLAQQLPEGNLERSLLLTAGSWALYQQAGQVTEELPNLLQSAPAEQLSACSLKVTEHLSILFESNARKELMPEALKRLGQARLRLPYKLLPIALAHATQHKEMRALLLPVLGERGYWLSRINPDWHWVSVQQLGAEETVPADAEKLWQEGTREQREKILERLRKIDPDKAREWTIAIWKQEKVETRALLISLFGINLSGTDEAFLEKALDDRGESVRSTAALLLARLPNSALARRMLARADALLDFSAGVLTVTPPTACPKDWQRDGISAKPPRSIGERTWWLRQVLSLIPLNHWEERFAAKPNELLKAATPEQWEKDAWYPTVLEAWSAASILHNVQQWLSPLWDVYGKDQTQTTHSILTQMQQDLLEQKIAILIEQAGHKQWTGYLEKLAQPWSAPFGVIYLQSIRKYLATSKIEDYELYALTETLNTAAIALPPACFEAALQPWILPEADNNNWYQQHTQQQVQTFIEQIQLRKYLIEELPL